MHNRRLLYYKSMYLCIYISRWISLVSHALLFVSQLKSLQPRAHCEVHARTTLFFTCRRLIDYWTQKSQDFKQRISRQDIRRKIACRTFSSIFLHAYIFYSIILLFFFVIFLLYYWYQQLIYDFFSYHSLSQKRERGFWTSMHYIN